MCLVFFSLFFSSFLGTLLDILYLFVHFCFCPLPPLLPHTHTEDKTMGWAVSLFIFFFTLTVFRKRTGGGWIPPFCTFVTFVHGNHTGAFWYFFVPRGRARVATQMTLRKGRQRKGLWGGGGVGRRKGRGGGAGSFSSRGRLPGEWG